jgi:hypothetical protein
VTPGAAAGAPVASFPNAGAACGIQKPSSFQLLASSTEDRMTGSVAGISIAEFRPHRWMPMCKFVFH